MDKRVIIHGIIFSILSIAFLFLLHHLPVNQLFIDPFSEAIKNHDVMDVACSRFRNHDDPSLYDKRVIIINSGITDREKIARTMDYLSDKGVGAIGIDLLFDSLGGNFKDTLFSRSLDRTKNIVLGYTFSEDHGPNHGSLQELKSDTFFTNHSKIGYVNLSSNDGFSVRAFEPLHTIDAKEEKAFSLVLASQIDTSLITDIRCRAKKLEWINFKRYQPGKINYQYPINTKGYAHYTMIDIDDLLADTIRYPADLFEGKIVLIGFCGENEKALSMKDRYYTPLNEQYFGRSLPDMYGVVVHANIISMMLDRDFINELSERWLYVAAFLIFFFNYLLFRRLVKRNYYLLIPIIRLIQVFQFVFLFTLCVWLMAFSDFKIGFILIITAVILSFEFFEFYQHRFQNKVSQRLNAISKNNEK